MGKGVGNRGKNPLPIIFIFLAIKNKRQSLRSKYNPLNTLFERISTSEKKRIARVAMELSSLNESLKGYLISGDES